MLFNENEVQFDIINIIIFSDMAEIFFHHRSPSKPVTDISQLWSDDSIQDVTTNDVTTYDISTYDDSIKDVSSRDIDIYDASNPDVSCFDPTMSLYIVSDLCKENLRQRLDRMSTEDLDLKSIRIFAVTSIRDIASGLDYLHKQGNYLYFFGIFSH